MPTPSTTPTLPPLLSLLPSYTPSTLPPRLLAAADSLLTQSRQRAPHLKAEEEIARPHACAELAIDRLREALRLPPKKTGVGAGGRRVVSASGAGGGPPCKPAVYRKLLEFLRGVLEREGVVEMAGSGRKRKRGEGGGAAGEEDGDGVGDEEEQEQEEDGVVRTPSKRARGTPVETPTKKSASTKKGGSGFVGKVKSQSAVKTGLDAEAPQFVRVAARRLCKVYDTPAMAPHVYTGSCEVLHVAGLWPPTADDGGEVKDGFEGDVLAMVVALYLMVLTKMGTGQMKTTIFNGVCEKALEMFASKGLAEKDAITEWIKRINSEGWCKGQQWFESVPENKFVFNLNGSGADEEVDVDGEVLDDDREFGFGLRRIDMDLKKEDPEGVLLPGLGTMMQDSVDWCSEARRRQFELWKKGILKRLQEADGGGASRARKAGSRTAAVH
ncbi:uncharacterized protein HMPREF1541_03645 [Cyphellophora europaea CBS 101466]|uniref:ORC6 first cyclin-like domain-containing protein n=1 Tax=Cyphellophora europaea (strain CBS 101466) TaxID=1220924 RepID=W2S160_CYPE1|nr:uncharacterized protein HMPREF1541_03645 [Cyphellophora europaea CBS 101466]ETN41709.1 hypothetical protein HMPREF1541_03645 [Cyphellophora europaea CBS 101466]